MMETIEGNHSTNRNNMEKKGDGASDLELQPETKDVQRNMSMSNLITWNISKALEENPCMDLKSAIRTAQDRLERDTRQGKASISQHPDEHHLLCALLAWQQLGHADADGLYEFIICKDSEDLSNCETKPMNFKDQQASTVTSNLINRNCKNESNSTKDMYPVRYPYCKDPVVTLPVDTKIIIRADSEPSHHCHRCKPEPDTSRKISAACCMDSECAKNLAALDADTEELKMRAAKLAKREAERVELLERAEAAWGDLERGYQRRLKLAQEKEEDMAEQITKAIQERNNYKNNCSTLTQKLKDIGNGAEFMRAQLKDVEKNVCVRACNRLKLTEEAAKVEAALADQQCKAMQLERDLQFKEEQARRKLLMMDSETESARVLMHEAERALRAELSGLREQIGEVSALLLQEDETNRKIKEELEELRKEKSEMIEDLDGCKMMCEKKMQAQVDELQKKRKELEELKDKVIECRCKIPVDAAVEVKRTASLAALCLCAPEDRLLDGCSCTSLRSRLISTLLADLFGGLQSELNEEGFLMPCQMLKCLEDKHNWDRASVVKNNLQSFFSKLLVGELDIAIATSIEKYHAKWTGAACADEAKMQPSAKGNMSDEGWEQQALEQRAQKLAEKLAEQLFQERAEELTRQAKEIVTSGPPPCECNKAKPPQKGAAVLQRFVEPSSPFIPSDDQKQSEETPAYWQRTHEDVTQLRLQIEDLKKESIKKKDLKLMEDKIAKMVKQVSEPECEDSVTKDNQSIQSKNTKKDTKYLKTGYTDDTVKATCHNKSILTKKKILEANIYKKCTTDEKPTKQAKKFDYNQSYAVNMCMCGPHKPNKTLQCGQMNTDVRSSLKSSKEIITQVASTKQTKPVNINVPPSAIDEMNSKITIASYCGSNCKCFQKVPSCTSIDKLLETLTKWKYDLTDSQGKLLNNPKSDFNSKNYPDKNSKSILKNKLKSTSKVGFTTTNHNVQVNETELLTKMPECFERKIKDTKGQNYNLPTNTASEYITAVNLDRSNEDTYVVSKSNNLNQLQDTNENILNECPNRCINIEPSDSQNKDVRLTTQSKHYNEVKVLNEHLYGKIKNTTDLKVLTNSKSTKTLIPDENTQKEICNETNLIPIDKTELLQNNSDYNIKFLGVTLADVDFTKIVDKSTTDNNKSRTFLQKSHKHKKNEIEISKSISELTKPLQEQVKKVYCSPSKLKKSERSSKFEEFQKFMINIFSDQLKKENVELKDIALDSPSLRSTDNHLENCACCHKINLDNSKDLEVNAFYLLEDYLKERIKEFKICSCKSSCFSPEEESKIFSTILKRVKEVISDCANEAKRNENGVLITNGSWRRAYGLLQEYLKIKLKRVHHSPLLKENKDIEVPDVLKKVCQLIENDLQRLKKLCRCKNNDTAHSKNIIFEHLLLPHKDIPEKDTNIPYKKTGAVMMLSRQNSAKPLNLIENSCQVAPDFGMDTKSCDAISQDISSVKILSQQNSTNSLVITQNISSQVPPDLGMETKSCDALAIENRNEQAAERNFMTRNWESPEIIYNSCDCYHNKKKPDTDVLKVFKNKNIPVNLYANILTNSNRFIPVKKQQEHVKFSSKNGLSIAKSLPNFEIIEIDANGTEMCKEDMSRNNPVNKHPYLGCTIDCTCNGNLKHCVCAKSVIQNNKNSEDWKQFIANSNNNMQDFSYIMKTSPNKNKVDIIKNISKSALPSLPTLIEQRNYENTTETTQSDNDIVLLQSMPITDTSHQDTNTSNEITTFATDLHYEGSINWCPHVNNNKTISGVIKFTNQDVNIPTVEPLKNSDLVKDTESDQFLKNCDCDKVPICHVKMLVEDIERNIIESKCTCDSISKICPVHSRIK